MTLQGAVNGMSVAFRYLAGGAAGSLIFVLSSCNSGPVGPAPGQTAPVPAGRLELVAPPEIAPGESIQLTANVVKSDGSLENVSSRAQWTSEAPGVLQVNSAGLATGAARGEVFVSVHFGGTSASKRVLVLPEGTFRLTGFIRESGFGLANVGITASAGVGEVLTALSRVDGSYAIYGVSGPVLIVLKKQGYLDGTQPIDVTSHRTHDFNMKVERPRLNYSGTYTLTITAASVCRPTPMALPVETTPRVYAADVAQEGGYLAVTLTHPDFIVTNGEGNRFFGFVDPTDAITFTLGDAYDPYYYVDQYQFVERFRDGALIVVGTVAARGAPGLITGTLAGVIATSQRTTPPYGRFTTSCHASGHRFEMVRRN